MYSEITQKILELLEANIKEVKTFYFGKHDIRKPNTRYPFIDVKWRGGPISKTKTGTTITRRQIDFEIRCVHRHVNENVAEKFVMARTEEIETVLDANNTIGELAESSRVTEAVSDMISQGGYCVVASLTGLRVKK